MIIKKPSRLTPRGIFGELLPTNFMKFQHPHQVLKADTRKVKVPWDVDEDLLRSSTKAQRWKSRLVLRTHINAPPATGPRRLWCVVSGAWLRNDSVYPTQIFPPALGSDLMYRVTGVPSGIYTEASSLMLPKHVGTALTDWALAIVPDPQATCKTRHPPLRAKPRWSSDHTPREFQFRVIDAAHPAMPEMVYPPAPAGMSQLTLSVAELDGQPLRFANRNRPLLPVVYFHACCAIWKKTYLQLQNEGCDDLADFRTRFLANLSEIWGDKPSGEVCSGITPIFLLERQDTPRTYSFRRGNVESEGHESEGQESEGQESEGQEIKVAPEEQVTKNPTPAENQAEVADIVPEGFFESAFKDAQVPVSNAQMKKERKAAKKEKRMQMKLEKKEAKRGGWAKKNLRQAAGSYRLVLEAKKGPEDVWKSLNMDSVAMTPQRRANRAEEPKVASAAFGFYRLAPEAKKGPEGPRKSLNMAAGLSVSRTPGRRDNGPEDPRKSLNMAAGLSVSRTPGRRDNEAEEPKVAPAAPFASLRKETASLDLWATFRNSAAKEVSVARTPEPRNNQAEEADKAFEVPYASLAEAVEEEKRGHQDPWATFQTEPAKEVPVTRHPSRGHNRMTKEVPVTRHPSRGHNRMTKEAPADPSRWRQKIEKKKMAEQQSLQRASLERALLERAARLSGKPEAQHSALPLAPKKHKTLPHGNQYNSKRGKTYTSKRGKTNKIPKN